MKKIAILGPNLESQGGVNVVIEHLKNFFISQNIEVYLYPVGKTNIKESKYIHPINSNNKKIQLKLLEQKFMDDFNLVIANNLRTHYLLSNLNVNNDLYVFHQGSVLQEKNFITSLKQKIRFKKIYNNKRVVFLNKCFKDEFLRKFNVNIEYTVIPNPFDFEKIKRKADQIKINGDYILGVGRFTKSKNFDFLLKAYAKGDFSEELWLLGDGEERENLQRLAVNLGIEKKVKFLGWHKNPFPYIKNAKILVHPSKFEALPTILIEALILNTPVIATDIKCGPGDILMNELKDFLVPLNNVEILSDKMKKALKSYPKIKDEYIEKYRLENVGCQYLRFLQ